MDDDNVLMIGALALVGVFWWWRNQQGTSITEDLTEGLEGLGDFMTTVANNLWIPPAAAKPYLAAIAAAESRYGLPTNLLARLLHQESRFRPDIITGKTKSPAGAVGIAQFMPATAKELGVNPLDPFASIDAAGRYLQKLYARFNSWPEALAAYNWGQGNVSRKGLDKAPLETRNYFSQILADLGLA
jgi:soluble lytic murein transglycosylase-like protein